MPDLISSPDKSGEITARLEAATAGPWMIAHWSRLTIYMAGSEQPAFGSATKEADADLIAHAPEDIRYLLTELERWRDATWKYMADVSLLERHRDAALALHRKVTVARNTPGLTYSSCAECSDPEEGMSVSWPCATVQALGVTS